MEAIAGPSNNRFVIHFSDAQLDFNLSEWLALTDYLEIDFTILPWTSGLPELVRDAAVTLDATKKYIHGPDSKDKTYVDIHEEQHAWKLATLLVSIPAGRRAVHRICERSVSIKHVWEVWAEGPSWDAVNEELQSPQSQTLSQSYRASKTLSWRLEPFSHGATPTAEHWQDIFKSMQHMAFQGPVKLKDSDYQVGLGEIYDRRLASIQPPKPNRTPLHCFVGLKLNGPFGRTRVDRFDVKKRPYIGNTTMESEASLRMAQMALAGPGKMIWDPFAGTGSMLCAAAEFGAFTYGSELDARAMKGNESVRGSPTGIMRNAEHYGLSQQILDCIAMDFTQPAWRPGVVEVKGMFDAIITDPPYGVRAGAKKLGARDVSRQKDGPVVMPDGSHSHELEDFVYSKRPYHLQDLIADLLEQSARMLKDDGRLVFFLPTVNEKAARTAIPNHPDMQLCASNTQHYVNWSRILVTMRRRRRRDGIQPAQGNPQFKPAATTPFRRADEDENEFRNRFLTMRANDSSLSPGEENVKSGT